MLPPRSAPSRRSSSADLLAAVEAFLASSREPFLTEPGLAPFPMSEGCFEVRPSPHGLMLSVWDETRNLSRHLLSVEDSRPGRLQLKFHRFHLPPGVLVLHDAARPSNHAVSRKAERHQFRELVRSALHRALPRWRVVELSADLDQTHSLSANYPRAFLRHGAKGLAAIAAAEGPAAPRHALTYGLIWLDYLRRREPDTHIEGLALLLPRAELTAAALRLRHMNPAAARFQLFSLNALGHAEEVDLADYGNLDTQLTPAPPPAVLPSAVAALPQANEIDLYPASTSTSLRFRGLEIARIRNGELELRDSETSLANQLAYLDLARNAYPADPRHTLYARSPEAWLESVVRRNLAAIDPSLLPAPLYNQIIGSAGVDAGITDLLGVDAQGRLAILELKSSEDIHLPLQALDYWLRIHYHASRGELERAGYFPNIALTPLPPRLLLVAPALQFHPTTETILQFFSSNVQVERIGIGLEWRHTLRPLFRYFGAERPV